MNLESIAPKAPIVRLHDLVTIKKGKKVIPNDERSEGVHVFPILKIDQLRGDEPTEFAFEHKGVLCSPEDVLIVWDGANAGTVGTNLLGYVGSTIAKLEIKRAQEVHHLYLYHFLKSRFKYLNQYAEGAAIPHLDRSRLLNLELSLPPLEVQIQLVEFLEKSSGVSQKERKKLELTEKLIASIFREKVGPLAEGYKQWPTYSVDELVSNIRSGPFGSQLLHSEFTEDGDVLVLGIDNTAKERFEWSEPGRYITNEKYGKLKRYKVFPGDVIVTIMGATTGRAAVVPNEIPLAITTKHLATLTLVRKLVHPDFVASAFNYHSEVIQQMNQLNRGAIMKGLSIGTIRQIQIPIPPMNLQQEFSRAMGQVRDMEAKMHSSLQVAEQLYTALAQSVYQVPLNRKGERS